MGVTNPAPTGVSAGSNLTLTCNVTTVDLLAIQPMITWSRSDGTPVTGNNELTFSRITTSDADSYTCSASINIPLVGITDRTGMNSVDVLVRGN